MTGEAMLAVYLNDHLAGSEAALALLDRLVDTAGEGDGRRVLQGLRTEIAQDQEVLVALIHRVGSDSSSFKRAVARLAEKAARFKLGSAEPGETFALFESLEVLALGIEGKRSLWRALAAVGDAVPACVDLDLDDLSKRAERQHEEVERWRLAIARAALAG